MNGVQKSSVSIAYDELGRPCRTTYGSGSNAITESTTYTIQGWTASKWSDLLRPELALRELLLAELDGQHHPLGLEAPGRSR